MSSFWSFIWWRWSKNDCAEKVQRHDLLSSLLAANDHTLDATTLSEDELIGLWATIISFLCFYKIILQAIYSCSSLPVMRFEFASLSLNKALWYLLSIQTTAYTMLYICYGCVISRGTRKNPTEDMSLVTSNIRGEKCTIPIPKDVSIIISITGLHYNRKVAYYLPFMPSYLIPDLSSLLGRSLCLQTFPLPRRQ